MMVVGTIVSPGVFVIFAVLGEGGAFGCGMFAVAFVAGVTAGFFWLLCVRARGRGGLGTVAVVSTTPFPAGATTTPLSIPTSTFSVHT